MKNDKNAKLDRLMRFQVGLIIALLVAIISLNFTTEKKSEAIISDGIYDMDDMLITPPPTTHEKKISPPPPKVEVVSPEEIIEDETIFEEEPEPIIENPQAQTTSNSKDIFKIPVKKKAPVPKKKVAAPKVQSKVTPPPVIEEKEELPPVVKIAEVMPMFKIPKKENPTEKEIKQYSDKELIAFINKNVKYTAIARENGIEGTAVVRFVVEKDGSISGIEVLRDPGGGLGEAAKKVVTKIPTWERIGRQNGVSVRVYYTLPIKFVLNAK